MKSVRVLFSKKDRMKFVSHLDMNRFMNRMLRLSGIPIWYTEGYNPHPYITFALPLPLGYESDYEILDFKCTNDNLSFDEIKDKLTAVMPEYIVINSVYSPQMKAGDIAYSSLIVTFFGNNSELLNELKNFMNANEIIIEKKTKRGTVKQINVAEKIKDYQINAKNKGQVLVSIVLPSGSEENINPQSVFELFKNKYPDCPYFNIKRTGIFDKEMNLFV